MTSLLVWKSLDIYAEIYQRFSKQPFQWDKAKKKAMLTTKAKELIFYYYIVFGQCGILWFFMIFMYHRKENDIPSFIIMLHVLTGIWVIFCFIIHLFMMIKGNDLANGWNKAIEMESILRKRT